MASQLEVIQMHYYHHAFADGIFQTEAEIYFAYSVNRRPGGSVITSGVTRAHSTSMGEGAYNPPPINNTPPKSTNCSIPFWDRSIAVVPCVVTLMAWEWDHGANDVADAIGGWATKIGNALYDGGAAAGADSISALGGVLSIAGAILGSLSDDYIGSFSFNYPSVQNISNGLVVPRAEPIPARPIDDALLDGSNFLMTKIVVRST